MVTSATYRQSSTPAAQTLADDPDNTLFGRMTRRRLEGEAVRDALLAVSGRLDLRTGGPSVFPDLPPGVETRGGWTRSASAADRNRRSIYVFVRRNLKYPLFDAFDQPDTNTTCPERNISVNAPQALMLLNSDLVLDHARSLAGRVLATASDRADLSSLVSQAYRLAFGRKATDAEISRGVEFLRDQPALLSGRADHPRSVDLPDPMPDGYGPAQGAAFVDYCHVLLNLNEFVFLLIEPCVGMTRASWRARVYSYLVEHYGDIASVVSLFVTFVGFAATIINVRKARRVAEEAQAAAAGRGSSAAISILAQGGVSLPRGNPESRFCLRRPFLG